METTAVDAPRASGRFHVDHKRAVREGSMDAIEGAQVPPGWWLLGALAVALPLVWLPAVLMAGGASGLRILPIPILNGIAWWWAGARWQRRWRVDRRLRAIPFEWHWRDRFEQLRSLPTTALTLTYLLAYPYGHPEIAELMVAGAVAIYGGCCGGPSSSACSEQVCTS